MRQLIWTPNAREDYLSWDSDKKTRWKINAMIKEILRNPSVGTGKPEPLRGFDLNAWSRRINEKTVLCILLPITR